MLDDNLIKDIINYQCREISNRDKKRTILGRETMIILSDSYPQLFNPYDVITYYEYENKYIPMIDKIERGEDPYESRISMIFRKFKRVIGLE